MKVNGQPLHRFVFFWLPITPPHLRTGEDRDECFDPTWVRLANKRLAKLAAPELETLTEDWRRDLASQESAKSSAESRANALLLTVGLVNGLAAIVGSTLAGAALIWVILFLIGGVLLVYSATATAFLSLRVGQVRQWTSATIDPRDVKGSGEGLALQRAVYTCIASHRNAVVLRDPVGYLRDAQTFALVAVVAVAILAIISTAAALTRGPSPSPNAPAASPSVTLAASPNAPASVAVTTKASQSARLPLPSPIVPPSLGTP